MKTKQLVLTVALASAFSLQPSALVCAAPLDSAISYQGRLADGPNPASGSYDLRFSLHTAASGPQLGTAITNAATLVTNGLFTVTLDFGGGLFTGEARWLEIGVRTSGGAGDFTTLTPRQPLTAAPYALYAPTAGSAATATTAASVPAAGITGTLPDGLLSTNVVLMDYGNISANAISANTFWGNAIGLTNLNSSNLTGDLTVAGGFMTERSRWFNGYGANDAVLVGSYLDPDSLLYLANGPELRILDVRNESAPICVGYYNLTNGALLGLAVSGHYAYAACGVEGLRIFDVATPTNIVNVGHIDDDGGAGYAWAVAVVGNYAYLANHADGVRIYDVSNPAAPALVAHINDGGEARDVFVYPPYPQVWQHIYVANGPDGLRIYDVTTPASPTNLAHIPTTYHARAVCVDQHINLGVPIAYVAEYSQVEMVQVQYPAAAYVVGTIHSHGYVSDVKVKGTEVFLSSDHNGAGGHLEVVSVLDTSHIRTTCEISSLLPMRAVAVDPGRQFLYGANDVGGLVTYQVVRTGTATAPFFQGDGRLLGNLDASHLTSGTLPDARLSGTYSSALTLNNRDNDVHGAFTGDGSQITNLNVASLTGTLADARLSSNVALLNTNQTFTGSNTFSSVLTATNAGNVLNGTLTGNLSGNATTATTAGDFTGSLSGDVTGTQDATVVSTVSGQSAANVASGAVAANAATSANTASTIVKRGASGEFSAGDITASNVTGSFTGGGSGLTNVNAHHLEGQPASAFAAAGHAHDFINLLGTVADAQLSGNVALLNTNQTFTGSNIFSSVLTATNAGNVLSGT
ncbi:MAG: hypothetical protein MUF81_17440, partial [Verrucomicrobia bacterium]|nr:hypothetical protein [Verrucomicrobiota bacterium]